MTTLATIGHGVKLQRETTTPGTYEDIAELITLGDYDMTRETVDVTTHDSPGGVRQFLPGGYIDVADITAEVHFLNSAQQQTVRSDFENKTKKKWRIVWPLSPVVNCTVEAYVIGFKIASGDASTPVKASITLKPASQPTWS